MTKTEIDSSGDVFADIGFQNAEKPRLKTVHAKQEVFQNTDHKCRTATNGTDLRNPERSYDFY